MQEHTTGTGFALGCTTTTTTITAAVLLDALDTR